MTVRSGAVARRNSKRRRVVCRGRPRRPPSLTFSTRKNRVTVSETAATSFPQQDDVVTLDRRRADRREDRPDAAAKEPAAGNRRKKQRRRHIDPTTCERDYSGDEIEFMRAMDDYKNRSGRMFPTCSEVLEVVRDLGYVKLSDEQRALIEPAEEDLAEADAAEDTEFAE